MKKKILIAISTLIIIAAIVCGCSKNTKIEIVETTTIPTTIIQTTLQETTSNTVSTTKPTTTKATATKQTTSKIVKETTRQTTTKSNTTEKVTTTNKPTTTETTEEIYWCIDGGTHHLDEVGEIGWVDTHDEALHKALRYIDDHADSGGFRVDQCPCGLYTAYVTLH